MRIVAVGIAVVMLAAAALAYSVLRTPVAASGPIEAIPLEQSTTAAGTGATGATAEATEEAPAAETTEATPAALATATAEVTAATTAEAVTVDTAAPAAATTTSSGPIVAQIVQEESEARFVIDEVLNGAPKTVVGATNQVAGELEVDPQDPSKSRVGIIQVNARALTTDSGMRNRTIANQILRTNEYEFVTFTPKELVGLPAQGSIGQSYTFQIVGDLQIRDVTKEVTFDVTVTPVSETRLEGTAQATILYADFGITIPQVRQVASVSDQVRLEIDFVAVPK